MRQAEIVEVRKRLLRRREVLLEAVSRRRTAISVNSTAEPLVLSSEDDMDAAPYCGEDAFMHLQNAEVDELDKIAGALEKMDRGKYGICEFCREEIAVPRLKALPHVAFCIGCQRIHEVSAGPQEYHKGILIRRVLSGVDNED